MLRVGLVGRSWADFRVVVVDEVVDWAAEAVAPAGSEALEWPGASGSHFAPPPCPSSTCPRDRNGIGRGDRRWQCLLQQGNHRDVPHDELHRLRLHMLRHVGARPCRGRRARRGHCRLRAC